jgi:hypothetical protein
LSEAPWENLFELEREEMLSLKAGAMLLLLSFALNAAEACDGKKRAGAQNSNQAVNAGANVNGQPEKPVAVKDDLKILAEGQHSPLSNAFIYVARDAETYAALRKVAGNLPELNQDFFKSNLVLAAFLGERRTGGYGVRVTRAGAETIRVEELRPPKGAMTIQVITYPFAVVAVPVSNDGAIALDTGDAWRAMTRAYKVKDGEFTMTGGIAGRSEKFGITGSLGLMREGSLATFIFELQSKGGTKARALKGAASGLVQADGTMAISNLQAGTFVDPPADLLRANAQFAKDETSLSLTFESIPGIVNDGFNGRGSLNAAGPAPQKKKASTEEMPQ